MLILPFKNQIKEFSKITFLSTGILGFILGLNKAGFSSKDYRTSDNQIVDEAQSKSPQSLEDLFSQPVQQAFPQNIQSENDEKNEISLSVCL